VQMKKLVEEVRGLEVIFGKENFGIRSSEEQTAVFRRLIKD